jgi:hypothetical protein
LDSSVIKKLEDAVAGGGFVLIPRAEADALRSAGTPVSHSAPTFSEDDLLVLTDLIRIWRGVSAMGSVATLGRNALYALGALIGVVLMIKGKVTPEVLWKALFG